MGFEIKYLYHSRKEDGSYDTEKKEEKLVKVGKPFDETSLEKVAASIIAQLARRDIWVIDVKVFELVKKELAFKECKDGKGITIKGKRYSLNETAQMVSEEIIEETSIPEGMQPHEFAKMKKETVNDIEELYSNPNKQVSVQKQPQVPINKNRVIYKVLFDPPIQYIPEAKRLGLRLTQDNEYSVHQVIQHPTGKLELQKIAITDDLGRVITVDEKFFTTLGTGLLADKQLNFSGSNSRTTKRAKLSFEDQLVLDNTDPRISSSSNKSIPLDNDTISENFMDMPDIRSNIK
jgi:hypothetical protein